MLKIYSLSGDSMSIMPLLALFDSIGTEPGEIKLNLWGIGNSIPMIRFIEYELNMLHLSF